MPDPTQSEPVQSDSLHSESSHLDSFNDSAPTGGWLIKVPVAPRVDRLAELNDLIRAGRPSRRRRVLIAAARIAATFCIGVAATLAWQPYGDAARMMIANASPQLGWLAPQAAASAAAAVVPVPGPRNATPADLDVVQDRVDRMASTQEQMTRAVAQLVAGQEQIAKEIAKVREVEQYLLYKTSYKAEEAPPPRPVTAALVGHRQTRRPSPPAAH